MKDMERHIENIAGKGNPFRTPEGYFEDFADRFMAELPERTATESAENKAVAGTSRTKLLRMVAGIAASVCIAIGGTAIYMSQTDADMQNQLISDISFTDAEAEVYESEMVDYTMMDNMDIYAYMADE